MIWTTNDSDSDSMLEIDVEPNLPRHARRRILTNSPTYRCVPTREKNDVKTTDIEPHSEWKTQPRHLLRRRQNKDLTLFFLMTLNTLSSIGLLFATKYFIGS